MTYEVLLLAEAQEDLRQVSSADLKRIIERLFRLSSDPNSATHEALTGRLSGLLKMRVGDYRVVYTIDRRDRRITVHFVGHRSDVYE